MYKLKRPQEISPLPKAPARSTQRMRVFMAGDWWRALCTAPFIYRCSIPYGGPGGDSGTVLGAG